MTWPWLTACCPVQYTASRYGLELPASHGMFGHGDSGMTAVDDRCWQWHNCRGWWQWHDCSGWLMLAVTWLQRMTDVGSDMTAVDDWCWQWHDCRGWLMLAVTWLQWMTDVGNDMTAEDDWCWQCGDMTGLEWEYLANELVCCWWAYYYVFTNVFLLTIVVWWVSCFVGCFGFVCFSIVVVPF